MYLSWSKYQLLSPIVSSDHSALSVSLDIRQRVPEFTIHHEVLLKSRADWDAIASDISSLPWGDIRRAPDPGSEMDRYVSGIVRSRVPSRVIRVRSRDKPGFDD